MKPGWFRNQLTPSKRVSEMYGSLADIIQDIFEEVVEPILSRISARKSFFTMADEDLDTRIGEMGKFFTIRVSDASSKPMLCSAAKFFGLFSAQFWTREAMLKGGFWTIQN
ncbi:hypothetical protein JD793_004669 [Citrobacter braakii]|nr:hypothetical protein [Citrobacter braakii]